MGGVLSTDATDFGWTQCMYEALMSFADKPGYEVQVIPGVWEAADAQPHFATWAEEGYNLIIGESFMYPEVMMEVARAHPDTVFMQMPWVPVTDPPTNYLSYKLKTEESGYCMGVVAARMTTSNKIGFISGMDAGEISTAKLGYIAGAHSINPDIEIMEIFTGDFVDLEGGKEAATSAIEAGADVLYIMGDGLSKGAITVANEQSVWVLTEYLDKSELAPDVILWGGMFQWDVSIQIVIDYMADGQLPPEDEQVANFALGGLNLTPPSAALPQSVVDEVLALKESIANGTFVVTI